jgi:uncharacterized protein YkwD
MSARRVMSTLLCLACLGPAAAAAQASDCPGADVPATAESTQQVGDAVLCLLNEQRASAGVPALAADAQLAQMATTYAGLMATESFFSHVSPEGQTMQERFAAADYRFDAAGENLAWAGGTTATPAVIVDAWMHSADHRENILDADFHQLGVGYAYSAAGQAAYYDTEFGTPLAAPTRAVTTHRSVAQRRHPKVTRRHARARAARARARRHTRARHLVWSEAPVSGHR